MPRTTSLALAVLMVLAAAQAASAARLWLPDAHHSVSASRQPGRSDVDARLRVLLQEIESQLEPVAAAPRLQQAQQVDVAAGSPSAASPGAYGGYGVAAAGAYGGYGSSSEASSAARGRQLLAPAVTYSDVQRVVAAGAAWRPSLDLELADEPL